MTSVDASPAVNSVDPESEVEYVEKIVRYNIRRYCQLLGRSQNSLAPALGVTSGAVSQMMTGYSRLKFGQVYLIAKELGVSMGDLMDDSAYRQDEELREKMLDKKQENPGRRAAEVPRCSGTPRGIRTHNPRLKRTLL